MVPVLIIAGLFGLYVLLERNGGISTSLGSSPVYRTPVSPQQGATVAIGGTMVAATALQASVSSLEAIPAVSGALSSVPGVGQAIGAAVGIIAGLLAAHEQRLKDAKTENARVGAAIPSFYNTIVAIVNAYNAGQVSASDAINGLAQLDQITYQQFRQFVGTPGTAWNSNSPGVCDKSCTVACCVYNTWLHPDIYGAGAVRGVIPIIQSGGGNKGLAGIPTNKYGLAPYPHFSITIK